MAQTGIDIDTLAAIATIVGTAILILAAIWGIPKYREKIREKAYTQGVIDGQANSENARFLVPGDIIVSGGENVFETGRKVLDDAKNSIKIITVTGAAWLLDHRILPTVKKKAKNGTSIQIILIDPQDDVASHIDKMEQLCTSVERPYDRPTSDISSSVKRTMNELNNIADIRLCTKYFSWKGTISDSSQAFYTIYDIPRKDTPMRHNNRKAVVKHFEKYFFDMLWNLSRPV